MAKDKKDKKEKRKSGSKEELAPPVEPDTATAVAMEVDETPSKKKDKKKSTAVEEDGEDRYESRLVAVSVIAKPLAPKRTNKKALKTVKKATKAKHVRRGVKEVVKALRKGEKGLVIIAGDISPIDVISHIPVLCEDCDVPYFFTPSKEDLGLAGSTKRPTSCVMIVPGGKKKEMAAAEDYMEGYNELVKEVDGASAW